MQIRHLLIISILFWSCSPTKKEERKVWDHSDCASVFVQANEVSTDTSAVKLVKTAVFDTTAVLISGNISDQQTHVPIANARLRFFVYNGTDEIFTYTNSAGEFKVFQNIGKGPWHVQIIHAAYRCLFVHDIVKSGGQWYDIKLNRKIKHFHTLKMSVCFL